MSETPLRPVRPLILAVALAVSPTAAGAGAWTQAEGAGALFITTGTRMAPVGSFTGNTLPEDDQTFTSLLGEYGVTPDLTVGVRGFGAYSLTDPDDVTLSLGGIVRYRLWTSDAGDVASVQTGVTFPAERWLGNGLGDDRPDSVPEFEIRALYGRGWVSDWGNSFVSTELGFRARGEGQEDEILFDATVGHRWNKRVQPLLSVFSRLPLGDTDDAAFTVSPSLAYSFWPFLSDNEKREPLEKRPNTIQLGLSYDVLNRDDGLGFFVSYWRRF